MNSGAVISRHETREKRAFYGTYPQFSILDPEVTYSLPKRQIACGLADTFVHVLEQYLTTTGQSRVMDRWAEGILHTVVEVAPRALSGEHDYDTMSDYMLSATLALIDRTIARTEEFFRSLGLSTRLSQEGIGEATIAEIERRFNAEGVAYGEAGNVTGAVARRILEACL